MRRSRSPEPRAGIAPRRGASLFETLVALTLTLAVGQLTWGLLAGQLRAAGRAAEAADRLDAARIVRVVLGGEVRAGRPGRDWRLPDRDSLFLRALRGVALPCADGEGGNGDEIRVRYRGVRRPDPAKDSVLLIRPSGARDVRQLRSVRREPVDRGGCPGWIEGESVERWGMVDPGDVVLARLFERGSYHLVGGALRYRRGRGGRQPLTPGVLDDEGSELVAGQDGRTVHLVVGFRSCVACPLRWRTSIRGSGP